MNLVKIYMVLNLVIREHIHTSPRTASACPSRKGKMYVLTVVNTIVEETDHSPAILSTYLVYCRCPDPMKLRGHGQTNAMQ